MRLLCIFLLCAFLLPAESALTADDFQNIVDQVISALLRCGMVPIYQNFYKKAEGSAGQVAGHPGSLEGELKSTSFLQSKSKRFFRFMHAADTPLTKVIEMTEDDIRKILGEELSRQLLPLMNALSITAEGEPKPVDFEGHLEVLHVSTLPPPAEAPAGAAPEILGSPAIATAPVAQQQNPAPVAQFRQSCLKLHEKRKSLKHD